MFGWEGGFKELNIQEEGINYNIFIIQSKKNVYNYGKMFIKYCFKKC